MVMKLNEQELKQGQSSWTALISVRRGSTCGVSQGHKPKAPEPPEAYLGQLDWLWPHVQSALPKWRQVCLKTVLTLGWVSRPKGRQKVASGWLFAGGMD